MTGDELFACFSKRQIPVDELEYLCAENRLTYTLDSSEGSLNIDESDIAIITRRDGLSIRVSDLGIFGSGFGERDLWQVLPTKETNHLLFPLGYPSGWAGSLSDVVKLITRFDGLDVNVFSELRQR